jgi:hypothetical protein
MDVPNELFSTLSGKKNRDAIVASLSRFFLDIVIASVSLAVSARQKQLPRFTVTSLLLSSMSIC